MNARRIAPLAVVTGASSGIGRELARQAARHGLDVVLIARRADRLHALAAELGASGVQARPVVADLSQPAGPKQVAAAVGDSPVDVLINAAGFGGRGAFATERDLARDLAMIGLNVTALVQLTGLFLPGMLERGRGRILNVASIAGYLPGPNQAVYNASKAFVTSFTQALAEEARGTGVHVTALCPGPVATEFAAVAGTPPTAGTLLMPVRTAAEVAAVGWAGMMTGRAVIVPDLRTRIGVQVMRFVPWRLVVRYAEKPRPPAATSSRAEIPR